MQLEAENARLKESLAKSSEVIVKKDEKIASLENQLYWLRKKVFGQMSEKHLQHGTHLRGAEGRGG